MAVTQNPVRRSLQVKLKTGLDANNKDIIKTMNFAKVKTAATPDAVHAVAAAMTTVLGGVLYGIYVADSAELINE
jgi:hypothetical protein